MTVFHHITHIQEITVCHMKKFLMQDNITGHDPTVSIDHPTPQPERKTTVLPISEATHVQTNHENNYQN